MIVRKAFRYRIYPNKTQEAALSVQFGHARFVYNWGLNVRKAYYQQHSVGLDHYSLKRMLTKLKRQPGYAWLLDADSQVLQAKLEDLDRAYTNFFEGRAGYPKFKSKKDRQSIRYPQRFKFNDSHVYLPKVGWVKAVFHRPLEGTPKNVTVSKTKSGEYYVSVQCEIEMATEPNGKPAVGVDLGLKHFATLSTGEKVEHPQYLRRAERRLKRLQRRLSRKKKGSRNRDKARLRVARQHEHVARQRADFLHKLSHRLVTQHGLVKLETLNVCGMLKNHSLAKSISDSGWGMFSQFCDYKAPWYGSDTARVDRFYPSSKTCHVCGLINDNLMLSDRFWTCEGCGAEHDRDDNASINLLNASTAGAAESSSLGRPCKTTGLSRPTRRSQNQEAKGL
jgi:putative transposase